MFLIFALSFCCSTTDFTSPPSPRDKTQIFRGIRQKETIELFYADDSQRRDINETVLKLLTVWHQRYFARDFSLDAETETGFKFKNEKSSVIIWIAKQQQLNDQTIILAHGLETATGYSEQIFVTSEGKVFIQNGNEEILYNCGSVAGLSQQQ